MSAIKWIKISVDMFDDEKVKLIEKLPESDTILIIWIKLLTLAGRKNASGYIFLTESIPYTDEMLAHVMDRDLGIVRMALDTFQKFGMIQMTEEDYILISNWDKHQSVDRMDQIREQQRLRKQKSRLKQQMLEQGMDPKSAEKASYDLTYKGETDIQLPVTFLSRDVTDKKEKEKENKTKKENINKHVGDDSPPSAPNKKPSGSGSKKKKIYDEESIEYQLASHLYKRILDNNPKHKEPDLHKWADVIRLMIERDERDPAGIKLLIDWVQDHDFWMSNILSTSKLREKWDQLVMQYKRDHQRGGSGHAANQRHSKGSHQENRDYDEGAEGLFAK